MSDLLLLLLPPPLLLLSLLLLEKAKRMLKKIEMMQIKLKCAWVKSAEEDKRSHTSRFSCSFLTCSLNSLGLSLFLFSFPLLFLSFFLSPSSDSRSQDRVNYARLESIIVKGVERKSVKNIFPPMHCEIVRYKCINKWLSLIKKGVL